MATHQSSFPLNQFHVFLTRPSTIYRRGFKSCLNTSRKSVQIISRSMAGRTNGKPQRNWNARNAIDFPTILLQSRSNMWHLLEFDLKAIYVNILREAFIPALMALNRESGDGWRYPWRARSSSSLGAVIQLALTLREYMFMARKISAADAQFYLKPVQ